MLRIHTLLFDAYRRWVVEFYLLTRSIAFIVVLCLTFSYERELKLCFITSFTKPVNKYFFMSSPRLGLRIHIKVSTEWVFFPRKSGIVRNYLLGTFAKFLVQNSAEFRNQYSTELRTKYCAWWKSCELDQLSQFCRHTAPNGEFHRAFT
jgi:hypothetical protein